MTASFMSSPSHAIDLSAPEEFVQRWLQEERAAFLLLGNPEVMLL
jgi:hypothetical protein